MINHRRLSAAVGLALALAATAAAAAEFSRDYVVDSDRLTLHNMIGRVEVAASADKDFHVTVHVRGADAAEGLLTIVQNDDDGGTVAVGFPVEEHDEYVYPEMGRRSKAQFTYRDAASEDGSWLRKVFGGLGGDRVTVRGKGHGLEVWADVTVAVPEGASLRVRHRVGAVAASEVSADLDLDTSTGDVAVSGVGGDVLVDTGSGEVTVARVTGDVSVDTGSGEVRLEECRGQTILVDTGSGAVELRGVECRKLTVDTGSGGVEARSVAADQATIDTGSGSVVLQFDRMGDGRFLVDTGSGDIDLVLPPDVSARIVAETGSGRIRNDLDDARVEHLDRDSVRLVVGGGAADIVVDAGSGSVSLSRN